ncbi:unnamed protein product [Didymodactylos carnosus]|uniref:Uncharacterized protein n=1 Tax=Didymodactylos carnosus TaxID=1234261 RepID=A0A8S2FZ50_9BILA|nr:unnamed protein product [Didymodactylos carnosus]CAF4394614.1 unnamed protein product [Didymodactylos carnosus]
MHSSLLGQGKKILMSIDLDVRQANIIDTTLLNLTLPDEFHRRPRSIQRCSSWKAQEYRTVILYLCPVILRDVLSADHYGHVLLFVCAIRLLHCDYIIYKQAELADILLKTYENTIGDYYGKKLSTLVLHVHRHFPKEFSLHGSSSSTSCFPLERRIRFFQRDAHGTPKKRRGMHI